MKDTTKILVKGAIINCGICTALINGIINYFTLAKTSVLVSSEMGFSFFGVALGCGLICPFFGGIILKGVISKNNIYFGAKSEQALAKFVPNNLYLGALVIGILTVAIVWVVPYLAVMLTGIEITLARMVWVVAVGVYSGVAASFAAYFGMKRYYYAKH